MRQFGLPCLYAALAWWFTTGAILFLDSRAVRTFRWSMSAATLVLLAALYTVRSTAAVPSIGAAYTAFSCAILVWGWLEMSFLMGYITGPRRVACSKECGGFRHFLHASQAVIYNELATAVAAGALFGMCQGMPNRVALWTFLILWTMRISAKLNLFFGVPNLAEDFLPAHLQYLRSFFRHRTMNFLFPISITASTLALALLIERYRSAGPGLPSVSYALLVSLLGLAILEHWFMVLPLPSERLWTWALRGQRSPRPTSNARAASRTSQLRGFGEAK